MSSYSAHSASKTFNSLISFVQAARDGKEHTAGNRLVLIPSCTLPLSTTHDHLASLLLAPLPSGL